MSGTVPRKDLTPVGDASGHAVYLHEDRGTYHT